MPTITQSLAWTKTTTVRMSPPSVKSLAVLSGSGVTVNGKSAKTVTIPRTDSSGADLRPAFVAALTSGRNRLTITRTSRGRPSTVVSADALAARLRAEAAAVKPRKARTVKADAPADAPAAE